MPNGNDQVQQDIAEQEQARSLRQERMQAVRKYGKGSAMAGTYRGARTGVEALEKKTGLVSSTKIEAPSHSQAVWIIAIILAICKDLLDIGTIELVSWLDWIVDIFIGVAFFLLFGRSIKLTRRLITLAASTLFEAIPGLGFLPLWTISVLYLYFKSK